jgi:hypothetical protein
MSDVSNDKFRILNILYIPLTLIIMFNILKLTVLNSHKIRLLSKKIDQIALKALIMLILMRLNQLLVYLKLALILVQEE